MNSTVWIEPVVGIGIALFTVATGWLFYQINKLHDRISGLRDDSERLMRDHEKGNQEWREDVIDRLARIEANDRK